MDKEEEEEKLWLDGADERELRSSISKKQCMKWLMSMMKTRLVCKNVKI